MQKALFEIENDLFSDRFEHIEPECEVFVTGLPRAGTTLILDLLYRTGEFSAFTYRQMPFVMSPLIWSKLSRPFQKVAESKERAHGDGVQVSFDSPEAFEEIIWLAYLRKKIVNSSYRSVLASGEHSEEVSYALRSAIKKLIYLDQSQNDRPVKRRYLSKNNANTSRIDIVTQLFPSSTILVPFRAPASQVRSLMEQHARFLTEHQEEKFSQRYMSWLGHFEFGGMFRPINFDLWLKNKVAPYEVDQNFWLEYWVAAFSHLLDKKNSNVYFLDFDQLLKERENKMEAIADCVGLDNKMEFMKGTDLLRVPKVLEVEPNNFHPQLWRSARDIYEKLREVAI